jgi:hypothetical protein
MRHPSVGIDIVHWYTHPAADIHTSHLRIQVHGEMQRICRQPMFQDVANAQLRKVETRLG